LDLINWNSYNTDQTRVFPKLEGIVINPQEMMMMGGGESTQSQQSGLAEEPSLDEVVNWLEDLWAREKEVRDMYNKQEWNEFIDDVEGSYP
jgi:hypothetical protein